MIVELANVVVSSRDENIEGVNVPKDSLSCARYGRERLPTSVKEYVLVGILRFPMDPKEGTWSRRSQLSVCCH